MHRIDFLQTIADLSVDKIPRLFQRSGSHPFHRFFVATDRDPNSPSVLYGLQPSSYRLIIKESVRKTLPAGRVRLFRHKIRADQRPPSRRFDQQPRAFLPHVTTIYVAYPRVEIVVGKNNARWFCNIQLLRPLDQKIRLVELRKDPKFEQPPVKFRHGGFRIEIGPIVNDVVFMSGLFNKQAFANQFVDCIQQRRLTADAIDLRNNFQDRSGTVDAQVKVLVLAALQKKRFCFPGENKPAFGRVCHIKAGMPAYDLGKVIQGCRT